MNSIFRKKTFFVDLFVRVSNKVAINMYTNLGYIVYRTVLEYYSGDPDDEDAFGKFSLVSFYSFGYFIVTLNRHSTRLTPSPRSARFH